MDIYEEELWEYERALKAFNASSPPADSSAPSLDAALNGATP
jgi:hypothetical protein